jgi:hypothetical protein
VWQRETIYYILNPGKIRLKAADEIRTTLLSEEYGAAADGGNLAYRVLDGTVEIGITLEDERLRHLGATFNVYGVPVGGIGDALSKAQFVLSPFLSPPEVKALCFVIGGELPGYTTANDVSYSLALGGHTLFVTGSIETGDMHVRVVCNTLLGESP